VMAH